MYNNSAFASPEASFNKPVVPPDVDPTSGGLVAVWFNPAWTQVVLGALTQLLQATTWDVDNETDRQLAQDRAMLLMNLLSNQYASIPGIAISLTVLTKYDSDTDQVEVSFDGGTTYTPAPGSDPRTQSPYPPQTGGDARCFSAASVVRKTRDVFASVLTPLAVGLEVGSLGFFIVSLLLDLGPFGILLDAAVAVGAGLIGIGATALEAALTDTVYDDLLCILFTYMDDSGQLDADGLASVQSDISSIIGTGDAGTAINFLYSLMGYGGINQAAALMLDTDDCSGCGWCYEWDFTVSDGGFTVNSSEGTYSAGVGWQTHVQNDSCSNHAYLYLSKAFGFTTTAIEKVEYDVDTGIFSPAADFLDVWHSGSLTNRYTMSSSGDGKSWAYSPPSQSIDRIDQTFNACGYASGWVAKRVRVKGSGTMPAFTGGARC